MVVAKKSPQPSPIPPLSPQPRQPELAGPPVKRVLRPWVSSWITMPASKSPSLYGVAVFQMYILQRPFIPSGGVMKLALLYPLPS